MHNSGQLPGQSPTRTVDLAAVRDTSFQAAVARESGQKLVSCYQCGNCTAGCAYTQNYDIPVHKVMRLVQLGDREAALSCRSLWLCATCQACTTRCPNNIDVARVMDVLRHMARRAGYAPEPCRQNIYRRLFGQRGPAWSRVRGRPGCRVRPERGQAPAGCRAWSCHAQPWQAGSFPARAGGQRKGRGGRYF